MDDEERDKKVWVVSRGRSRYEAARVWGSLLLFTLHLRGSFPTLILSLLRNLHSWSSPLSIILRLAPSVNGPPRLPFSGFASLSRRSSSGLLAAIVHIHVHNNHSIIAPIPVTTTVLSLGVWEMPCPIYKQRFSVYYTDHTQTNKAMSVHPSSANPIGHPSKTLPSIIYLRRPSWRLSDHLQPSLSPPNDPHLCIAYSQIHFFSVTSPYFTFTCLYAFSHTRSHI